MRQQQQYLVIQLSMDGECCDITSEWDMVTGVTGAYKLLWLIGTLKHGMATHPWALSHRHYNRRMISMCGLRLWRKRVQLQRNCSQHSLRWDFRGHSNQYMLWILSMQCTRLLIHASLRTPSFHPSRMQRFPAIYWQVRNESLFVRVKEMRLKSYHFHDLLRPLLVNVYGQWLDDCNKNSLDLNYIILIK